MDNSREILINEALRDSVLWGNAEYLKRYLDLIFIADHNGKQLRVGNKIVSLERGQIVVKSGELADRWEVDKRTVQRFIQFLIKNRLCAPYHAPLNAPLNILNFSCFWETEADFLDFIKKRAPQDAPLDAPLNHFTIPIIKRKKESKPKKKRKHTANEPTQDTSETTPAKSFKQWTSEDFKDSIRTANETIGLSPEDLHDFYDYWTEPSASGKQRYHRENTWDTQRRLRTWSRNLQTNFKR